FDPAQRLCWTSPTATAGDCTTPPADATTFDHDTLGNRTSELAPDGTATALGFDQANCLADVSVTEPVGGEGQYHQIPSTRIVDTRNGTGTCTPSPCGRVASGTP